MAKGIIKASEDVIIPLIIKDILIKYLDDHPEHLRAWESDLKILGHYCSLEKTAIPPKLRANFNQRVMRIRDVIVNYMVDNKFTMVKGLAALVGLAQELQDLKVIEVTPQVNSVYDAITKHILIDLKLMDDDGNLIEDPKEQDENLIAILDSANKQRDKIWRMLQKYNYFTYIRG